MEIASVLCDRVSQEAVDMHEQLNSTLIRLMPQTDAGIVVTTITCGWRYRPPAGDFQGRVITRYASFVAFNKAYLNFPKVFFYFVYESFNSMQEKI